MDERPVIYRSARIQIILAALFTLIVYTLLLGRQGQAQDVLTASGFTFVSFGDRGGIHVYDLQDIQEPVQVGVFDTTGTAEAILLSGTTLYIADGPGGLRLVNVSNPAAPALLSSLDIDGRVQGVDVWQNFALVAAGQAGLVLVDVTYPNSPVIISSVDTPGDARAVDTLTVTVIAPGVNEDVSPRPGMQTTFAYVAGGSAGLQVIDLSQLDNPTIVTEIEVEASVNDVLVQGQLAYIAAGRRGLLVYDLTNPVAPALLAEFDTDGEAAAVEIDGSLIYVADTEEGLAVLNLENPPGDRNMLQIETPGEVHDLSATVQEQNGLIYVADGPQGLRVLDLSNLERPAVLASLEVPGEASFSQILSGLFATATGQRQSVQNKVWHTLGLIFFDLVLFLVVLSFWLVLFSQFVLPVTNLEERASAIRQIFSYYIGRRGPAIFIRNGQILARPGEEERPGAGVALLDTASAAVFRNRHAFTRASGPGILFTRPGEYPAGAVDLHQQVQIAGPMRGEDPFAEQGPDEPTDKFQERQRRRYATSALTRDGVEVVPTFALLFTVDNDPNQGKTQFGYNADAVWRAIAHEAVDPDAPHNSIGRRISWAWLPVRLAVDIWRESLRKFSFDDLFTFSVQMDPQNPEAYRITAYDTIVEVVKARLTQPEAPALDDDGRVVEGQPKQKSKEYALLSNRGLQVHGVSISSLRFPDPVDRQLIEHWKATWLQRAQSEQQDLERIIAEQRGRGQDLAVKEFAAATAQLLGAAGADPARELSPQDTLKLLLEGTLKVCIREHMLHPQLTTQKSNLLEIIEWIETH